MKTDKSKAVLNEDGDVKTFILTVGGSDYTCKGGCNCFHKPFKDDLSIYRCNGCSTTYKDKSDDHQA